MSPPLPLCRACLYAGILISGVNGEVLPSQWEYQVRRGVSSCCHIHASWIGQEPEDLDVVLLKSGQV